eukprot:6670057-Pyramimonas_sp.AAC.1
MTRDRLEVPWMKELGGLIVTPAVATCRPAKVEHHSVLDYFFVSSNLATRIRRPEVQEDCTTVPHLPVHLPLCADDLDMR